MLRKVLSYTMGIVLAYTVSVCLAKPINLYDQPKADAKVVGTIDPAAGIVPIYSPKQSDWLKVGDPQNGNVGWVKSSDLANVATTANGFSFYQRMINNGKDPQSIIMQFGGQPQLTPEQSQALFKQIQAQQAQIQSYFQQMLQGTFNDNNIAPPVIMPVVIMPQPVTNNQTTPSPQKKQ